MPVTPGLPPHPPEEYEAAGWTPGVCPVCGAATPSQPRYPVLVCDRCAAEKPFCHAHGLRVRGGNTGMSGGFVAYHPDGTRCEYTTGIGVVVIEGIQYLMGEARFGGVVTVPVLRSDLPAIEDAHRKYQGPLS